MLFTEDGPPVPWEAILLDYAAWGEGDALRAGQEGGDTTVDKATLAFKRVTDGPHI